MSNNDTTVREVLHVITEAFHSVQYPGDDNLITNRNDLESLEIELAFRGRKWQDLSFETVFKHRDSLPFFSPSAFRYYLPAYMCFSITNYSDSDTLPEYVVYQLSPPSNASQADEWQRFESNCSAFTKDQRKAIAVFLAYLWEHHSDDFPFCEPRKALETYWSRDPVS